MTAHAPCANFVTGDDDGHDRGRERAETVDRQSRTPAGLLDADMPSGHPRLRQRERREHADRVERDQLVDVGLEQDDQHRGRGREPDDPVREDQSMPTHRELAGHEVVGGMEVRESREVGE